MAPLIELRNCAFGYGGATVVECSHFTLRRGDFMAVIGPNGGGKTTLLRGLLGVLKATRGQVQRAEALTFGYVPQREEIDPIWPVSAMEVTLMGAYRRARWRMGLPLPHGERERAMACLARVGADAFRRKLFAELSGGQKQRVLMARALMTQPDVLVLDEPASGFDLVAQRDLLELLCRMHDTDGLTILMVSHQFAGLQPLVNSVSWVHNGRVQTGEPGEMLSSVKIQEVFSR